MKTTVAGCYFVNDFTQSKAYFTVFSISLPLNKCPLCLLSRFALSLEFRIKYHQLLHKIVFFSGLWHLAKKTSENTKKNPRSNSNNKSKQRLQAQVYYRSAVSSNITFIFIVCLILRPQTKNIPPIKFFLLLLLFLFDLSLSLLLLTRAIESKENRERKIVFGTSLLKRWH